MSAADSTTFQQEYADGLHALADVIETTPEACPPSGEYFCCWVSTAEEMVDLARTMGGHWEKDADGDNDYFRLVRQFGPHRLAVYTNREKVCERRVVGTRKVQRPATEDEVRAAQHHEDAIKDVQMIPMVEVEEEVVEWVCPPSLRSMIGGAA